jgi:uncharacterized protein (TIGR02145 family)
MPSSIEIIILVIVIIIAIAILYRRVNIFRDKKIIIGVIALIVVAIIATIYNGNKVKSKGTITDKNGIEYNILVSPNTNRAWLDRNLGAKRVCKDQKDTECFGDYYQWGRDESGFKNSNKNIDDTLWQNSKNDPCPNGFRVPTDKELSDERFINGKKVSFNSKDAFDSFLKLPNSGYLFKSAGNKMFVGSNGYLWSSSTKENQAWSISYTSSSYLLKKLDRANALPIRCIAIK